MQATHEAPAERESKEALADATTAFRHMVRLRLLSARMVDFHRAEKVAFHASCIGEEAAIVGAVLAMREEDWVFPGAREWGAAIVRGMPLATYVHHAFGNAHDPAMGHAAPDHAPGKAWRVVPASGVVGAHIPQAVGAAWAAKIKKENVATVSIFGEGATSTGDFHNALNFAGVFKAPCVLVCRNNGRAVSTPASRQTKSESFAAKAVAYGVASALVDGSDLVAVLSTVRAAIARAAEGKGATLVEVVTTPVDAANPPADLLAISDVDPVARLRRVLNDAAVDAIVREAKEEIEVAVAAAVSAPPLTPSTIFDHVYAELPPHLRAQKESVPWAK